MSWDVVLINSTQIIQSIEELDESLLVETDFCAVLDKYCGITNKESSTVDVNSLRDLIDYYTDEEPVSNKMICLYGENGLFELVALAKKYHWQIFDTSLNAMIDLGNPAKNGYENFQRYRSQVID